MIADRCVRDTKRAARMLVRFSYISLSWMSITCLSGWQWWSLDDPRWLWAMETVRPGQWSNPFEGTRILPFKINFSVGVYYRLIIWLFNQLNPGKCWLFLCKSRSARDLPQVRSNSSQIFWILSFENSIILSFEYSIILSFEYFILSFTPLFPFRLAETLPWLKSIVDWCCSVQPVFLELWSTELYLCGTLFEM